MFSIPDQCQFMESQTKALICPERIAAGAILTLIASTGLKNIVAAAYRALWYDELCTVAVSHQQSLKSLWAALLRAKDSSPPLYNLVEHWSSMLLFGKEIAYRLPSIVAFGCTIWCLFVFVRKYQGSACAFLCAMVPFFTPLYSRYAIEARSYSLVVACIAVALVCYQQVSRRSRLAFLGLALASAEAFHYYAFFSFAPFFLAELAWTISEKKVRWGVWLALSAGFLPMLACWPILIDLKRSYGSDFWGKPSFDIVQHAYDGIFGASLSRKLPGIGFISAAARQSAQ